MRQKRRKQKSSARVTEAGRPAAFPGHEQWAPYALLIGAVALLFVLQNYKIGFEVGHHGFLSSHGAALAKNLSFGDRLVMFHAASLSEDGKVAYETYNRFPLFPFAIIKAAMAPFEPHLSRQVYAARQTMNAFLALAMLFAFLAVRRWTGDGYLALAAVFLTFSSFYVLFYGDMIFNDVPALFGFALVAWAAVTSRTTGLTWRTAVAVGIVSVSMGWQPYAILGAWFLVDLVEFLKARREPLARLVRRPAVLALSAAVLWGVVVLGLQLANEASVAGRSITETGSVGAMRSRLGVAPAGSALQVAGAVAWPEFLSRQAERIVLVFSPLRTARYALASPSVARVSEIVLALLLAGAVVRIGTSRRVTWAPFAAVLIASGFLWAIPLRHFVAFHDFQTIFYVGLPLVGFTGLLLCVPRRLTIVPALLASVVFAVSVNDMNQLKSRFAASTNPVTYDFESIHMRLPRHSKVFVDGDRHTMGIGHHAVDFYLAGAYLVPLARADYVVSARAYNGTPLTANSRVNLFEKR